LLQVHPTEPGLWVYAAAWEFEANGNPAAARALMQQGLRMCRYSERMWLDYFDMVRHRLLSGTWSSVLCGPCMYGVLAGLCACRFSEKMWLDYFDMVRRVSSCAVNLLSAAPL
jgi:hypothetical protein